MSAFHPQFAIDTSFPYMLDFVNLPMLSNLLVPYYFGHFLYVIKQQSLLEYYSQVLRWADQAYLGRVLLLVGFHSVVT